MKSFESRSIPMNDFFGWKRHPFADTYAQGNLWLPERDWRRLESIIRLIHNGKNLALCADPGTGKTTLIHALMDRLDKTAYLPIMLPYAGHPRNGLTRLLAEALGVEAKGRGIPLIARIQQHIEAMATSASPRHPLLIVDDAQRVEPDSLWDLCSLLFQTSRQTVAASLILVGDQTLARLLDLRTMLSIRSRLTSIFRLQPLSEDETRLFINSRLKNAHAPEDLFNKEAVELMAAQTRGNRRAIMNAAMVALEEAYERQEKTITAETLYSSSWFNESE